MDREEIAQEVLVCVRQRDKPVPPFLSRTERCRVCGAKVWARETLQAQAYECTACVVGDPERRVELRLHPSARADLRAYGWSDEQIDQALGDMGEGRGKCAPS